MVTKIVRNPNTKQAYIYIRQKIISGEFSPGTFLSAQSIAKDIGLSRTPVREALRQLELSNLDVEFHRIIFKAAGNQLVCDRFERANILQRMMTLTFPRGSIPKDLTAKENAMSVFEEHLAIYEAILAQDGNQARNAMARHIENLSAKYMRWMRAKPAVQSEALQVAFL